MIVELIGATTTHTGLRVRAELDRGRQERLADLLGIGADRQVFVTAPRQDELPDGLGLPILDVAGGVVTPRSAVLAA